ncbi:MAG: GlsB/YeaQ/YmgE family stress response membrane protein [Oscillospiraceae bacterium]|nr:GlsB/YeaQ/YmgE family stress response membrane protein [Oscillospiraceae bacterium]
MSIIIWIIFGGVVGWLANVVMKGSGIGIIGNIIIGIVGSFLGGWIASLLGLGTITGFNLWSLLIAFLGSCLLIFIISKVFKK